MKAPDDAHFQQWEETPEPDAQQHDPQTILDANLDETAWLWNTGNEKTEWLVYHGEVRQRKP